MKDGEFDGIDYIGRSRSYSVINRTWNDDYEDCSRGGNWRMEGLQTRKADGEMAG